MPQVQEDDRNELILQLDRAPPDFNNAVRTFNENLPYSWIGRFSVDDSLLNH